MAIAWHDVNDGVGATDVLGVGRPLPPLCPAEGRAKVGRRNENAGLVRWCLRVQETDWEEEEEKKNRVKKEGTEQDKVE